jgi:hypothetical protein
MSYALADRGLKTADFCPFLAQKSLFLTGKGPFYFAAAGDWPHRS